MLEKPVEKWLGKDGYMRKYVLPIVLPAFIFIVGLVLYGSESRSIVKNNENPNGIMPTPTLVTPLPTETLPPTSTYISTIIPTLTPECMTIKDLWTRPGQTRDEGYTVAGQPVDSSTIVCVH